MVSRAMTPEEMLDFLQTNAYRDGDCLLWAGAKSISGNPRIMWQKKMYVARRLLLQLLGRPPGPKKVTETCGNKMCMNKDHLIVVTHKQAMARASRNGRLSAGAARALSSAMARAKKAKLPITEARKVMRMRAEGVKLKDICEMYGVSSQQFYRSRETWRRVGAI